MKTVGQLMTRHLHRVPGQLPLDACQRVMLEQHVRRLLLVDTDGRHAGVVSDVAVLRAVRTYDAGRPGQELVDASVVSVDENALATTVLAKMLHARTDCAVVLDADRRAIGLFTERDAMELARDAIRPWTTVGELMTAGVPFYVRPQTSAERALDAMFEHRIRHLLVLDQGALVGVISHRDLVGRTDPVSDLVSGQIWFAAVDTPVGEAVELMCREGAGCLPVVDAARQLAGILTRTDVLKALARQLLEAAAPPDEEWDGH